MKGAILFLSTLLFAINSFAQDFKKDRTYLTLQGGAIADFYPDANYFGFNFAKIAWSKKTKKGKERGLEFEIFYFEMDSDNTQIEIHPIAGSEIIAGFKREKFRIQSSFYWGKQIIETEKMSLLLAPIISLGLDQNYIIPKISSLFPEGNTLWGMGAGIYTNITSPFTKKIDLILGTKLFLFDFGYNRYTYNSPSFTLEEQRSESVVFDFIRNEIPISMGLRFRL